MADAFKDLLALKSKMAASWKAARKVTGGNYENIQSAPGTYNGVLKVTFRKIDKGALAGATAVVFTYTVADGPAKGQSNRTEYLFTSKPDDIKKTLERLSGDLKRLMPGNIEEITNSDIGDLLELLKSMADESYNCEFVIREYVSKSGAKMGQTLKALNPGAIDFSDDEDSEDSDEESDEEEDAADEAEEEESDDDTKDEADGDEEADDEESEDADEEKEDEEFIPVKGMLVKYGRSNFKISTISQKKRTVTLMNPKTKKVLTDISFDSISEA